MADVDVMKVIVGVVTLLIGIVIYGFVEANVPKSGFSAEVNSTLSTFGDIASAVFVLAGIGVMIIGFAPAIKSLTGFGKG